MQLRAITSVLAVSAAFVLAGCGGSGDGGSDSSPTTTTSPPATVVHGFQVLKVIQVHEDEYSLSPARIKIDRFGYYGIKTVNDGKVAHALKIEGHGLHEITGDIAPGKSKTIPVFFQKAGTYRMYCPIDGHEAQGMKGTIRVH